MDRLQKIIVEAYDEMAETNVWEHIDISASVVGMLAAVLAQLAAKSLDESLPPKVYDADLP